MAKAKRPRYLGKRGKEVAAGDPTEAVFRVDLATGAMRITDQKGDQIVEDPVTSEKIAKYGIEYDVWTPLAQIVYVKCAIKHGGCVIKIVNGREVLVW